MSMKAILCSQFCGPDDLVLADIADPVAEPGQVVIAIKSAALNFFDILMIQGKYQIKPPFPFSPAAEVAGVIESIGSGVTDLKVGDRVELRTARRRVDVWGGQLLHEERDASCELRLLVGHRRRVVDDEQEVDLVDARDMGPARATADSNRFDRRHRSIGGEAHCLHATDDLALKALLVEEALASDHKLGLHDAIVQIEFVDNEIEARLQATAERD